MTNNRQQILDELRKQNVNVFNLNPKSKFPTEPWKKYQSEKYTGVIHSNNNFMVICGTISDNTIVFDFDDATIDDVIKVFPNAIKETLVVKTKRGYHVYFKTNHLPKNLKLTKGNLKIDLQSDGKYVVGATSIHPDGIEYLVISETTKIALIDCREIVEKMQEDGFVINGGKNNVTLTGSEIAKGGIPNGHLHDSYFKYCHHLLKEVGITDWHTYYIETERWNQAGNNEYQINQRDFERTREDVWKFHHDKVKDSSAKNQIHHLKKLTQIDDPVFANCNVHVNAVIASNAVSYNVPSRVEGICCYDSPKHTCCHKFETGIDNSSFVRFVEIPDHKRFKILESFVRSEFTEQCELMVNEIKTTTIRRLRIRPIVSSLYKESENFFDDEGNEWTSYDVYILQNEISNLEAGKEISITGKVIADPKTSKVTMIISDIRYIDSNRFDEGKIMSLQEHLKDESVSEKMEWYCKEFEKYSKIIKRHNVTRLGLLSFFSPLYIDFESKTIPSWTKSLIIGDSTTGKSETIRQLIILLRGGQIINGEMSSVAGLAGASVQATGGQWFTEFGVLVLQDKKFLAIDGAHSMGKDEHAKLAEAERNGKIEMTKASKGEAYARTRQCKVMNPVDDERQAIPMNSFLHPIQSLKNNLQIMSIARLDFCCFVSDDIGTKERNAKLIDTHSEYLENLSELLKFSWSKNYTVIFEESALNEILNQAIHLESKFKTEDYPLITNDQKYKIAKLSASLAILTLSISGKFEQVTVTKEHISYISKMIEDEYSRAGLDELAKKSRHGEITDEVLHEILYEIRQKTKQKSYEIPLQILKYIVESEKLNNDDLADEFNLSRDNAIRPLITYLKSENIIKKTRLGFTSTKKGIEIARFINNFSASSASSASKNDTPLKNENEKKEGVSILAKLDTLDTLKIKDYRCTDCKTIFKYHYGSPETIDHNPEHTLEVCFHD